MRQIAEFVAVLACSLFTGAAAYVSLVEHSARMECGVEIAAAHFPPSYHRGTIMQVLVLPRTRADQSARRIGTDARATSIVSTNGER
jgi:hypothetical protein